MSWSRQCFIRQFSLLKTQNYRNQSAKHDTNLNQAAVLVGVVERDSGCHIILTQRADHLRHHPGQVSFPGGKVEPSDSSLSVTALRETHEEIGIASELINVIGQLPALITSSGFSVTPVVAMVNPSYRFTIDQNEVAAAFEVPVSYLMSSRNLSSLQVSRANLVHHIYAIPYREHLIWGATAQIIESLQRQCCSLTPNI